MKLNSIEIKNFYSFQYAKFSSIKDYNVIIGRNNAGKSNLFKLLNIVKRSLNGEKIESNILYNGEVNIDNYFSLTFQLSDNYQEDLNNSINKIHSENENITDVMFDIKTYKYIGLISKLNELELLNFLKISFSFNKYRGLILKEIKFINDTNYLNLFKINTPSSKNLKYSFLEFENDKNPQSFEGILDIDNIGEKKHDYPNISLKDFFSMIFDQKNHPLTENPILNKIIHDVYNYFITCIHYIPDTRRFEKDNDIKNLDTTVLLSDGSNFSKYLSRMLNQKREWVDSLLIELRKFFPNVKDFIPQIENDRSFHTLKEEDLELILKLENMGTGILNIAFFLAYFKYLEEDKLLLIEEPELYIFPGLQKKLRTFFHKISNKIQIFITSHSPLFLSRDIRKISVFEIEKQGPISKIKLITTEKIINIFTNLNLGIYDYLLYNGILFVEGPLDSEVFKIINDIIFEPEFKIIPSEGKNNFSYYANSRILNLLTNYSMSYLFLFDRDRGNENIWKNIKPKDFKEELENNTLKLFTYEIENIFLQPILIIDYLNSHKKIKDLKKGFTWIKKNIAAQFELKGENNLSFLLKKFIDKHYPYFQRDTIEVILEKTTKSKSVESIFKFWIKCIRELSTEKEEFCHNKIMDENRMIHEFKEIHEDYKHKFNNSKFNKIISGKEIFKKIRSKIQKRYKLSESITILNLTYHLVNFLNEIDDFNQNSIATKSFLGINKKKLKWLEDKDINEFAAYFKKIIDIILQIKNKLDCNLKNNRDYRNLDLSSLLTHFLPLRWNLN